MAIAQLASRRDAGERRTTAPLVGPLSASSWAAVVGVLPPWPTRHRPPCSTSGPGSRFLRHPTVGES